MNRHVIPHLTALSLACCSLAAQAAPQLDRYAPPNNTVMLGLSANGDWGVSATSTAGNLLLNSATGQMTSIGGNSSTTGFNGSLDISADGRYVAAGLTASNGYGQAARYDASKNTWTALGGLGVRNTTATSGGIYEESTAYGISANGDVVVGRANFSANGAPSSIAHPVVFRDGRVIDLNPNGGTQSGRALAASADGGVVSGFTSNGAIGAIWRWNGSSYDTLAAPRVLNPNTGAMVSIQATELSASGKWAAGGSVNALAKN